LGGFRRRLLTLRSTQRIAPTNRNRTEKRLGAAKHSMVLQMRLRGRHLVCPSTAVYGNRRARPTLPAADRERMSENAIIDPMKTAVYYYGDNPERSCHRRER